MFFKFAFESHSNLFESAPRRLERSMRAQDYGAAALLVFADQNPDFRNRRNSSHLFNGISASIAP